MLLLPNPNNAAADSSPKAQHVSYTAGSYRHETERSNPLLRPREPRSITSRAPRLPFGRARQRRISVGTLEAEPVFPVLRLVRPLLHLDAPRERRGIEEVILTLIRFIRQL
jgi:hypothetical protein